VITFQAIVSFLPNSGFTGWAWNCQAGIVALMLMDERASSAANAIEELRARRVIGTAIANFLNIVEYLFFFKGLVCGKF
ncbi:MAG: hypothetical protein IV106_30655, partial [Pseudomonas umsongensis]|nr:hypothetical protein [Pseudomonas umsongensis]